MENETKQCRSWCGTSSTVPDECRGHRDEARECFGAWPMHFCSPECSRAGRTLHPAPPHQEQGYGPDPCAEWCGKPGSYGKPRWYARTCERAGRCVSPPTRPSPPPPVQEAGLLTFMEACLLPTGKVEVQVPGDPNWRDFDPTSVWLTPMKLAHAKFRRRPAPALGRCRELVDEMSETEYMERVLSERRRAALEAPESSPAAVPPAHIAPEHVTISAGDCVSWCGGCLWRRNHGLPLDWRAPSTPRGEPDAK